MEIPRAAAFEKRIQRGIAWSIFPNFRAAEYSQDMRYLGGAKASAE